MYLVHSLAQWDLERPPPPGPKKPIAVLIKRKKEGNDKHPRRVIENHGEVLHGIEKAGWSVMVHDATEQDIPTQCSLFYEAELLVGPRGAGLTNMLCSCHGTAVIEIRQSDGGWNKSFFNLAEALGLKFIGLETKPPFSLPYSGAGKVNASAVGEAAAELLRGRQHGVRKCV